MNLEEVARLLQGTFLCGEEKKGTVIDRAYAADLLSDVLALTEERTTLITGTISPQVVKVADILNVVAIIFVRGKRPAQNLIEYAQCLSIPLVFTEKTMFETCGLLYTHGVQPCKNRPVCRLK